MWLKVFRFKSRFDPPALSCKKVRKICCYINTKNSKRFLVKKADFFPCWRQLFTFQVLSPLEASVSRDPALLIQLFPSRVYLLMLSYNHFCFVCKTVIHFICYSGWQPHIKQESSIVIQMPLAECWQIVGLSLAFSEVKTFFASWIENIFFASS